ncbi:MAG: protein translocase subunit SecD [Candidatus Gracilibacteria bacterium]|nr:protein translocase subunit SecD [Candidatus Gracilibacteria bacterium]
MRHLIFRLFLIFIGGLFLFSYIFPWHNYGIKVPFSGGDYRLGLDLQGGIELDYKVDLDELKKSGNIDKNKENEIVEGLKSIIDKRIEALKINDSEINDASYGGERHIIVQIPLKGNDSLENSENIEKAKEAIGKVVKIQFKERKTSFTEKDFDARKQIAVGILDEVNLGEKFSVIGSKYSLNYENIIIGESDNLGEVFTSENEIKPNQINSVKLSTGDEGFAIIEKNKDEKIDYIFVSKTPSDWTAAIDSNGRILDDKYFVKSSVQFNDAARPEIELVFNDEGAEVFADLTKRLVGQQIAIFVGGEMLTAPVVNTTIYGGKAVITGEFTPKEAAKLSQDINTGVVPAPIYLTSEKTIDSKIGESSLEKLILAGFSGFFLIFVFLVFSYRLSGLMSSIALMLYVILVLAVVKLFGLILTLASIAGLILSIGIAIDANILIFERIKEEIRKGNSLLDSTDIGFKKSWSAIWDSNFTGLIVSLILFIFGINMIKGFGLMLGIGIIISLFTAMYISRVFLLWISLLLKDENTFIGLKK